MAGKFISSWIEKFAYVPNKNELSIETSKGEVYTYADVPFSVADAMADAESVGKYHNQNLRGKYKCAKG
jgi:hypothetical protein